MSQHRQQADTSWLQVSKYPNLLACNKRFFISYSQYIHIVDKCAWFGIAESYLNFIAVKIRMVFFVIRPVFLKSRIANVHITTAGVQFEKVTTAVYFTIDALLFNRTLYGKFTFYTTPRGTGS